MKKIKLAVCMALTSYCFFRGGIYSRAAEGTGVTSTFTTSGEYTTIRVNAEDDSGGPLQYAIDSDAPEAFGSSNEFTVERGSEHTVYVKDSAGNISAQVYKVPDADVDMEVNIGYSDTSSMAQVTDAEREALEKGGGTMAERVVTDAGSNSERLFYTVDTKEGHVFYLVIDRNGGTDDVYLLDQVTDNDLYALAADGEAPVRQEEKSSVFDTVDNRGQEAVPEAAEAENTKKGKTGGGDWFFILLMILLGAAAFYYYKIYKPKQKNRKDMSDAMDLDEFEPEDEGEEHDVLDFAVSREERDAAMEAIINGSDFDDMETGEPEMEEPDYLNYDPEEDSGPMTDMPEEETEGEETEDMVEQLELDEDEEE